jgi:hypothetical protein
MAVGHRKEQRANISYVKTLVQTIRSEVFAKKTSGRWSR